MCLSGASLPPASDRSGTRFSVTVEGVLSMWEVSRSYASGLTWLDLGRRYLAHAKQSPNNVLEGASMPPLPDRSGPRSLSTTAAVSSILDAPALYASLAKHGVGLRDLAHAKNDCSRMLAGVSSPLPKHAASCACWIWLALMCCRSPRTQQVRKGCTRALGPATILSKKA